ncbi:MAG: hypothetical protein PHN42_04055 [Bacilli bacterium]|nr:hypothetical protein [Bacilli bacterium]
MANIDIFKFEEINLINEEDINLNNLIINRISKKIIEENKGKTIQNIYKMIEETLLLCTSQYFFPNHYILFYKNIVLKKASKFHQCNFSNALIKPGQEYILYKPFLEDISSGKNYVLKKTITLETSYIDYLPKSILEFEQLNFHLMSPENNTSYPFNIDDLAVNIGGEFTLQKLPKKKK